MKTKRLLASFLALCMLMMACSTLFVNTAFAATTPEPVDIVVKNDTATSGTNLTGKTFDVYEVFTATLGAPATGLEANYEQGIKYAVNPDFVNFFVSVLSGYDTAPDLSDSNVADTFNNAATDYVKGYETNMAALVKQLRTYVLTESNGIDPVTSTGETISTNDGVQSVTTNVGNLLGYYLVLDSVDSLTIRQDTAPVITAGALVTAPSRDKDGYLTKDASITIKGSAPKVKKEVWHNDIKNENGDISPEYGTTGSWETVGDYEIGDIIEFRVKADMPSSVEGYDDAVYTTPGDVSSATFDYTYILTDTPSDGLTLDLDSIHISTFPDLSNEVEGAYHTIKTTADGGFQIIFDMVSIKKNFPSLPYFYIYYTATLDESATKTQDYETNTITLEYSTNPYQDGETTTTDDTVYTFTFDLDILKTSGDGTSPLKGATFALYYAHVGTDAGTEQIYLEPLYEKDGTTPVIRDGAVVYYLTEKTGASDVMPDKGYPLGTITTGSTGKFLIIGLDDKVDYRLVEINAPTNYNPADPLDFTIKADYTTNKDGTPSLSLTTTNNSDITAGAGNALGATIINTSSALLPHTGGAGTTLFTIAGFALMIGVGIVFIIKYKKS